MAPPTACRRRASSIEIRSIAQRRPIRPADRAGSGLSGERQIMNVHAQLMKGQMLIGGDLVAGEANNWLDSVNPANEEKIGEIPAGDAADVNRAVAAAEKAQPAWAALDIKERGQYLHKLAKRNR